MFFRVSGCPAWLNARENDMAVLAKPRLCLRPVQASATLLDGGWWPRSADPAAELPGLVTALDERHGRITRVLLGPADWDTSRPRRLNVVDPAGSRVIRLGWFASMPADLLTAISANDERTDLVTIPPATSEEAAAAAGRQATLTGNREHAPAILAALTAAAATADRATTADRAAARQSPTGTQLSVWDWEGGQPAGQETTPISPAAVAQ
jgi:hypothetical protein